MNSSVINFINSRSPSTPHWPDGVVPTIIQTPEKEFNLEDSLPESNQSDECLDSAEDADADKNCKTDSGHDN